LKSTPMTPTEDDVLRLKSRFTEAGCTVTDIDDSAFQIVHSQSPVMTHVLPTPYYLQLSTVLFVRGQGFRPNASGKLLVFLANANSRADLAKFTDGTDDFGSLDEGWKVAVTAKLVTGRTGMDYDAEALENIVTLWNQDIANCLVHEKDFKVRAMM